MAPSVLPVPCIVGHLLQILCRVVHQTNSVSLEQLAKISLIDVANGVARTDSNGLTREGFRTVETQVVRMHLEKLEMEEAVIRFVGNSHT